ncbi:MAG TPA: DNA-3-methyladenine glycosylase 2 family protein [Blastocatellia bacterium]|jgi:DNA-3-methyladenine glycosylase II|nr:DNA-3-methyladenine glycosylase 2 family protein [Blastocatellia bacterium]HAF23532.1 DNA-3-methyladenine glycosylase 2 family protein [Blastocatellia bacterium]HCX28481.1 DNA-3-methyladenine glycosylase 2 family protein [Blastocatellia bacterium]
MPSYRLDKHSLATAAQQLATRDKDLALILSTYGPPPMWARRPGFATLVQIILEQQVSLASAASMFARLKQNIIPFQSASVLELGERHLKSLGLTRQKTAYCLHLAEALESGQLDLSQLSRMDDATAKSKLVELKGIGSWSADIYLLMALRRADIWPANDLALAVAVTKLRQLTSRPNANQLSALAEAWRPYRSVAARMLWQYYLASRNETGR